mmetsp:Transcript_37115/g.90220  ORF Transcript_37115/g.90220 Transcript_37115/m.90220 type:complete len:554 (+) Transcript_37115:78-1739(+)|eukprot:CAMPEP_0113645076 /NCGR_PEP_ID=MMETSP0017_2-20120614/23737_1 /TAXON_ID=2856 /ORGANISM="Cylindrotheca closterium" /LENGTH=553 /DNA_ID=CAMNT_0000556747 /DNA_START=36 /DNA_END=1694 /DNA_ORIENTATION=- /assembly_acc=CAM_ASM_000147
MNPLDYDLEGSGRSNHLRQQTSNNDSSTAHEWSFLLNETSKNRTLAEEQKKLSALTPEDTMELARSGLKAIGTDVGQNDNDPMGNGDQSIIAYTCLLNAASIFNLFRTSGFKERTISAFPFACIVGSVKCAEQSLQAVYNEVDQPYSRQDLLNKLLEAREMPLRLSPLLMVVLVSTDKDASPSLSKVAKLLLRAGASPDCKDALGKTALHYCVYGTNPGCIALANMCIAASKTSDLYGNDVVLEGLQKSVDMNGMKGIVGGYDYDRDRRSVFIPELEKEVWVKADNIRLPDGKVQKEKPMLVDVPDRMKRTPVNEAYLWNRPNLVRFLMHEHHASIDIKDTTGISPKDMSAMHLPFYDQVQPIVAAAARAEAKAARDAKKSAASVCGSCNKSLGSGGKKCSRCKATFYCSRNCQVQHWKQGHKQECDEILAEAAGVQLSSAYVEHTIALSTTFLLSDQFGTHYQKPDGVKVREKFVVSAQAFSNTVPVFIRDQSGTCQFQYKITGPGYSEIWKELEQETAFCGRKTFMKASFDEAGECTMYPSTACVKNKYAW